MRGTFGCLFYLGRIFLRSWPRKRQQPSDGDDFNGLMSYRIGPEAVGDLFFAMVQAVPIAVSQGLRKQPFAFFHRKGTTDNRDGRAGPTDYPAP